VATVSDGQNPGRSATPQRQSPGSARAGRAEGGLDPTEQLGQTPPDIFGFAQSYSTGAAGSAGANRNDADVTIQAGQLDEGLSGVTGSEITDTGAEGSQGATHPMGGESVRYTDPFGYMGNDHRDSHAAMQVSGPGDSTTWGADNGFSGPTLPVLEGNRPTDTGVGKGHVHAKHPNAGE
jgi:hypothetical protein